MLTGVGLGGVRLGYRREGPCWVMWGLGGVALGSMPGPEWADESLSSMVI